MKTKIIKTAKPISFIEFMEDNDLTLVAKEIWSREGSLNYDYTIENSKGEVGTLYSMGIVSARSIDSVKALVELADIIGCKMFYFNSVGIRVPLLKGSSKCQHIPLKKRAFLLLNKGEK